MAASGSLAGYGWMMGAGLALEAFGQVQAGQAAKAQGELQRQQFELSAAEADRQAVQVFAVSQRQAEEERRQARLMASRSIAVAAASGGGVSDPTVVRIISETAGEGAYRANLALYEGEARGRQLRADAILGRASGEVAASAGAARAAGANLSALGTLFYGGGSLFAKYGGGGPDRPPAARGDSSLVYQGGI